MSKGNDAADAIKRVVKLLDQMRLAADVLDEYGSFENAAEEARKRYQAEHKRAEVARIDAEEAEHTAKTVALAAQAELAAASVEGKDMKEAAKAEAKKIAEDAKEAAKRTIARAESTALAKLMAAEASIRSHEAKLSDLEKECEALQAKAGLLSSEISQKESRLEEIRRQVAALMGEGA